MVTVNVPFGLELLVDGITGLFEKLQEANCGRLEQESVTGPLKPLVEMIPRLKTALEPDKIWAVGIGAWPKLAPMWNGATAPEVPVRLLRVTVNPVPPKSRPFVPQRYMEVIKVCWGVKEPLAARVTVSNAWTRLTSP